MSRAVERMYSELLTPLELGEIKVLKLGRISGKSQNPADLLTALPKGFPSKVFKLMKFDDFQRNH